MELEEYIIKQNEIKKSLDELNEYIDEKKLKEEILSLENETTNPDFWDDNVYATKITKKISDLKSKLDNMIIISKMYNEISEFIQLSKESGVDSELEKEANNIIVKLEKLISKMINEELLGDLKDSNAVVTIHSGAGGTESCDWVEMLFRMYSRWADDNSYELKLIDYVQGDVTGFKSITFEIIGKYASSILESEMGVHRLIRISPFDSSKRRHTTFASVEVLPIIEDDIELEIIPNDLRIDTFRASGAGGQHINKTDSAVRITHIPTGIVATSQSQRSQIQNKEEAMKILKSRLYELEKQKRKDEISDLKADEKDISWGNQIRSYIFCPYTMVKDHRTGYTEGNIEKVLNGDISNFIHHYLISIRLK